MKDIYVIGTGQTPVGEHWATSLRHLAWQAIEPAMAEAGIHYPDGLFVGNMLAGQLSHQGNLAALIADFSGLRGIEALTVEASGASGAAALRQAIFALSSGLMDTAVVAGVEKMTDVVGSGVAAAVASGTDVDWEAEHGLTGPAAAALIMRRYMHEYGYEQAEFEGFSINAHANAGGNQHAMFRNTLRPGAFAKAGMVASPVNMFDSAPDADGAAAIVLATGDALERLAPSGEFTAVRITGSGVATDSLAVHDRHEVLSFAAVKASAEKALGQAQLSIHDIDVFELHDAYTIFTVLTLEALGLADPGTGVKRAGDLGLGEGQLHLSTFGGLKARGNPGGATGIYQVVEATQQLRGTAGSNQVSGATTALVQNLGGAAATAITHILQAETPA